MKSGRLLALVIALMLGGCAGLQQYPETTKDYKTALRDLDPAYQAALVQIYAADSEQKKKDIRNQLIEERMAVIDSLYETFEASLTKESVGAQFAIALAGIGVGAAGSLASAGASQMLSAVSGGLAGAQAAYDKSVFYDRAFSALVAQMRAGRKAVAAQIFSRWSLGIDQYPVWLARTDLQAYIFAGSLPGAIVSTASDASVEDQQAEEKIDALFTAQVVEDDVQKRKVGINRYVRERAKANDKEKLDAIATLLHIPIIPDLMEERNSILLEMDRRVVDNKSMDALSSLLHDATEKDF